MSRTIGPDALPIHNRPGFGRGDLAIIAGSFFWAIGAVVIKNGIEDTPDAFRVFVFNGIRMPVVSGLMFLSVIVSGRPVSIRRADIPIFASASFIGMFLFMVLNLAGLAVSTVANFGILMATLPLFILLLAIALRTEKVTLWNAAGIAVGFIGTVVLTYRGGGFTITGGDMLIILSCIAWAVFVIMCKSILARYSPVLAMAWILLFASVFQFPLFIRDLPHQSFAAVSAANWINLALASVVSLFGGNILFYYSLKIIGPTRVGAYSYLEPVFTLMLAASLRGERISLPQIAGLFIIFSGIGMTHFRKRT